MDVTYSWQTVQFVVDHRLRKHGVVASTIRMVVIGIIIVIHGLIIIMGLAQLCPLCSDLWQTKTQAVSTDSAYNTITVMPLCAFPGIAGACTSSSLGTLSLLAAFPSQL